MGAREAAGWAHVCRLSTAVAGRHVQHRTGRDRTPVCTIRSVRVVTRRRLLALCISGESFLHHMVRNIVGSLVEVGRGAHGAGWIAELLRGRDRTRAGPTAPAHGLVLVRVLYGPEAETVP